MQGIERRHRLDLRVIARAALVVGIVGVGGYGAKELGSPWLVAQNEAGVARDRVRRAEVAADAASNSGVNLSRVEGTNTFRIEGFKYSPRDLPVDQAIESGMKWVARETGCANVSYQNHTGEVIYTTPPNSGKETIYEMQHIVAACTP